MSMNLRSATFPTFSVPKGSWIQVCEHGQAQERLPTMQAGQQREGVPSSHWLSRVCLCMSLHAPSPVAPWEASAVVCVALLQLLERQGGRGKAGSLAWASCLLHVCLFGKQLAL